MRVVLYFFLSLFLVSCSCESSARSGKLRIGVDPSWAPLNFDELQPYVNGYTEDVLLEVSRSSGLEFEKVTANWDSLLEGMRKGQYDAVLTSMPAYTFNLAKYDFSQDFLQLGPVLITTPSGKYTELQQLSGELVGIISGDPAVLVLQKYPEVIIRNYNSIPELLDAVENQEIEAAVLDRLPAVNYVNDLYQGKLKVVSEPLTSVGLHLIVPKGKSEELIRSFNKSLERFEKKKTLVDLQKKWNLAS